MEKEQASGLNLDRSRCWW